MRSSLISQLLSSKENWTGPDRWKCRRKVNSIFSAIV